MSALLIVGAGATIEECRRSGNFKDSEELTFPALGGFSEKFFSVLPLPPLVATKNAVKILANSNLPALYIALQAYLKSHNISFDDSFLERETFLSKDMLNSSRNVFISLEKQAPHQHNIERFYQFVWVRFGSYTSFWEKFVYDSVYQRLAALFTQQFGFGQCVQMHAGMKVAQLLKPGDKVLNLNYDVCFEVALSQMGKDFTYSPRQNPVGITVFKPHGSINLFANNQSGNFCFVHPQNIPVTGNVEHNGEVLSPYAGIIPPVMEKSYASHPTASFVLDAGRPFDAKKVIFWGVGLTDSDHDLLAIYKEASSNSKELIFINPSTDAFERAQKLLGQTMRHERNLDQYVRSSK